MGKLIQDVLQRIANIWNPQEAGMAFEQGERVVNRFCGIGTVESSEVVTDEDGDKFQMVAFDNPHIGRKLSLIKKLASEVPDGS